MKVEQIYTNCLAEAAYYIESNGEAAIIDPMREPRPILDRLREDQAELKYIFETHFHADFVSGHLDLHRETNAPIVFGPGAEAGYKIHVGKDNEEFKIGNLTLKLLHTPGHTMESSSYLLLDENGKQYCVFTGDCLFIGDVGRPDLAVKSNLTQEDLAGHLYDSLRNKLMPLNDDVIVYPNHGAGSACGKMMSEETFDTLGHQKEVNYALQDMSKEEFIEKVLDGLATPPQYFPKNAMMNKGGYDSIDVVLEHARRALDPEHVDKLMKDGALLLDTREHILFQKEYIPGSVNIGLDGNFASWVGTLIEDINQPIVLIVEEERIDEAIIRLARVGYNNTVGYLQGCIKEWKDSGYPTDSIEAISAYKLDKMLGEGKNLNILDTRRNSEYQSEHVMGSEVYTLDTVQHHLDELDKDKTYYMYCLTGYRSASLISILKNNGYKNLINIEGGLDAIKETDIPLSEYVCPTTIL
jgi:glyoxylase-like metal-dependent hydrolase (beta-lactamase superfamily II)/rhodanese-related sulfurtransferase